MQRAKVIDTGLDYDYSDLSVRRKTDMVVIHHTGNPTDDDMSAQRINSAHKGQGWCAIGYHYVIRKDGTVEQGRPHWTVGAHAYGENSHTIGIHVCGNFDFVEPTTAQIESLAMLLSGVCKDYGLPIDKKHIVAHKNLMATDCCGENLYNKLDIVRGKAIWYQQN